MFPSEVLSTGLPSDVETCLLRDVADGKFGLMLVLRGGSQRKKETNSEKTEPADRPMVESYVRSV